MPYLYELSFAVDISWRVDQNLSLIPLKVFFAKIDAAFRQKEIEEIQQLVSSVGKNFVCNLKQIEVVSIDLKQFKEIKCSNEK